MQADMGNKIRNYDIVVVGAGVLGTNISYWLSELFDSSVALIDQADQVAAHMSTRNTGVDHRPFYLDPVKKKMFAASAQKSHYMWMKLARQYDLPWKQVSTLEIAKDPVDVPVIEKYYKWALVNGMNEDEVALLDSEQVKEIEPLVHSSGAIHSKTDTATDFGILSGKVAEIAEENGVSIILGCRVIEIGETGEGNRILVERNGKREIITAGLLINAGGASSVGIAHSMGLAQDYSVLFFRGEYWIVSEEYASGISRNIYSVPKHTEFPFLDPHFIVRADGRREVGPNAVMVAGPDVYEGLTNENSGLRNLVFDRPILPKLRLFTDWNFISLVMGEWESSLSKNGMAERVRKFIPSLRDDHLYRRGFTGVRGSVINDHGFVPEAKIIEGNSSIHIINFNSPGATGAPSWSAYLISYLMQRGFLEGNRQKGSHSGTGIWDYGASLPVDD